MSTTRRLQRSPTTLSNIERSAGNLSTAAMRHMETHLPWYGRLSAQERSWVGLVAQAGIASFIAWYANPASRGRVTADVFGTAPRELTGVITLGQTLDLVRTVVEVVEEHVTELAAPGEEAELNLEVLRYSREIAFAAAHVYADAAESRGAWDARLESLVVDAVLRGEADDELASRAAALGWGEVSPVAVVVASTPPAGTPLSVEELRRTANRMNAGCLVAVQGRRVILIVGGVEDPAAVAARLASAFGDGPIVVGPKVPHLFAAGRSARAALSGFRAASAAPDTPRPVLADDLLPERILNGDTHARRTIVDRVARPLEAAGGALIDTVNAYLRCGRSLEGSARELFVHPNTVRYRLGRIADLVGYDMTQPRDAYVVQTALAVSRLDGAGTRPRSRA
jgi:DNA-binding PucR family transcriptional regulator